MNPVYSSDPVSARIRRCLDPQHTLTREDIILMLEWIKKKVADEDPALLGLSQPRLLKNFRFFAEITMQLVHRHNACVEEANRLREWLSEASHGLLSQVDQPASDKEQAEQAD